MASSKRSSHKAPAFRWVRLNPLKNKRCGGVAKVLQDGRVLVQGGTYEEFMPQNHNVFPPAEVWDPKTGLWSDGRQLAEKVGIQTSRTDWTKTEAYGRTWPTLTTLPDGRILVVGGKEDSFTAGPFEVNPEPYDTAFIVEPDTGRQIPAGRLCRARFMPTVALMPDGSVMLIGGANNFCLAIDDVELGLPPGLEDNPIHRDRIGR